MRVCSLIILLLVSSVANFVFAMGDNLALRAKITVSSAMDAQHDGCCVADGIIRIANKGNWVSNGER